MLTWFKCIHRREDGTVYCSGVCLSSDDKPVGDDLCNGSRLEEMDTGRKYRYDMEHREWLCPDAR